MSVGFWREPSVTVALGNGRIVPQSALRQCVGDKSVAAAVVAVLPV